MEEYIDFIISIQKFIKGRKVIRSKVKVCSLDLYEVIKSIYAAEESFCIDVCEGNWIAFIFEDRVYIHNCLATDVLFTDQHTQAKLN
jgi:hypothetical protein